MLKRLVYKRADGKWAWNLTVNDKVIATDGGQGYENEAWRMADRVVGSQYSDAEKFRSEKPR